MRVRNPIWEVRVEGKEVYSGESSGEAYHVYEDNVLHSFLKSVAYRNCNDNEADEGFELTYVSLLKDGRVVRWHVPGSSKEILSLSNIIRKAA